MVIEQAISIFVELIVPKISSFSRGLFQFIGNNKKLKETEHGNVSYSLL